MSTDSTTHPFRSILASTPTAPATIGRCINGVQFELDSTGLHADRLSKGQREGRFSLDDALALADFFRSPGVYRLLHRAWLAQQHADYLYFAECEDQFGEGDIPAQQKAA
jgi:hypothetical protein